MLHSAERYRQTFNFIITGETTISESSLDGDNEDNQNGTDNELMAGSTPYSDNCMDKKCAEFTEQDKCSPSMQRKEDSLSRSLHSGGTGSFESRDSTLCEISTYSTQDLKMDTIMSPVEICTNLPFI